LTFEHDTKEIGFYLNSCLVRINQRIEDISQ